VSYSVSGTNCSISGSNLVASSPTTCSVTATKASNVWYNAISSAPVSYGFTVNNQAPLVMKHSPGIPLGISPTGMQWPFAPNQQIYLSTSGGSGTGTVNYSVSGANCSLNQTVLTATPASGTYTTCVVNATKAASPGYNATSAAPVSLIFGIYKQEPLFLPNWNPNLIGARMDLVLSTTGGSGSGAVSYSVSGSCYIEQGRLKGGAPLGGSSTCTVVANKAGVPGRYEPISSAPVTIPLYNPLPRVDQFPLILVTSSVPVGVKSITLSTSGGSGTGAVGYTLKSGNCVISGSTLSASVSTSCVVNAYKLADATYNLALSQIITFEFKLP
jgi:hypothetical protein